MRKMFWLLPVMLISTTALAEEEIIETIVAPATATNRRNTEGDLVVTKNGTYLLAWSDFYGGAADNAAARISGVRSIDGGRTWSPQFTLQKNIGKENVMSVSFLRLPSGEILFFFLVKNSRRDLDCMVRRSADDGATWSKPALITPEPGYYVMNNARVIQLSSGRILCPMSFTQEVWARGEKFRTVVYYSDDDGRTWRRGRGLVACPKRGAMEPGLIELADKRVLQIIRTQLGKIWHCFSSDGGDTWTEPAPWTVAAPEAPSTLARMPGRGEFLLVYNPTVRLGTDHSGPRTPLVAALSTDEGRTWSRPKMIEADQTAHYAYTSIRFHGDRVLFSYYVSRAGLLSLKFKSIPVAWLRQ